MTGQQTADGSRRPARRHGRVALATACAVIAMTVVACSSPAPHNHHAAAKPTPIASIAARAVPPAPRPCAVSATLVNSCRPWLGAAAAGNPGAQRNGIAQFLYLERLIDHHLDIYRAYNSAPGKGANSSLPLTPIELAAIRQPDTYADVNWQPAATWAQADGGNPAVNARIAKAADNIKAVAPHKIFLTVWWEPQNAVSGGTNCPTRGQAGTPAQYKLMWQNVERIFAAQGANNVVWTMDYAASYPGEDCLVTQLWPGNNLVDWVIFDSYDHDNPKGGTSWSGTVGRFYHVLQQDSSPSVDFDAKPWGLGEFGTCQTKSTANSRQYFLQAKQSIESNAYPKLKMYVMFAVAVRRTNAGCLTDYDPDGQPDVSKNTDIKSLFNTSLFNG